MKHAVTFVLGVLLLVGLVLIKASWHGPLAAVAFVGAWLVDREVARGLGRPGRWLAAMVVLVMLGAWLGPKDGTLHGVRFSQTGALAGLTMAARAIGLLLATTAITRAIPPERILARLRGTRGEPLGASVVVALRLAPQLYVMLDAHAKSAQRKSPGVLQAPRRWFEVLVLAVEHATALADEVALELASSNGDTGPRTRS